MHLARVLCWGVVCAWLAGPGPADVLCTPRSVDPRTTPCNGNGVVVVPARPAGGGLICDCEPGWFNAYTECSTYDCNQPNGYWNGNYWDPACTCHPGWSGQRCNITDPNVTPTPKPTPPPTPIPLNPSSSGSGSEIPTNMTGHTDNINPADPDPSSAASSSSSAVSTTMYIGIAIGIASMCGFMLVFGMLYRSRHRLNHLKQRLLNANTVRSNNIHVQLPNPTTITQIATVQTTEHTHNTIHTNTNQQTSAAGVETEQP